VLCPTGCAHLLHARLALVAVLPAQLGHLIAANVHVGAGELGKHLVKHTAQEGEYVLVALQG
jgi:sulfite reductase beta subunit-like hemoprotein